MLKGPEAPFLEIGVHDPERPAVGLLQAVLDVLAARGARSTGRAYAHLGIDPDLPFAGPTDLPAEEVAVTSLSDVAAAVAGRGRLVAVDVAGAFGFDPRHAARVTIGRIDDDLVGRDRNPVAIWASGGGLRSRGAKVGGEVRDVFEAVVAGARPAYGAITVEWPLLSPRSLARAKTANDDYHDVYLGLPPGHEARVALVAAAQDLTVVEEDHGVYVYAHPDVGGTGQPAAPAAAAFARAIRRTWAPGPPS